jgi:hypothetical protein
MDIFDCSDPFSLFVDFPIIRLVFHFLLSVFLLCRDISTIVKCQILRVVHIYMQKLNYIHNCIERISNTVFFGKIDILRFLFLKSPWYLFSHVTCNQPVSVRISLRHYHIGLSGNMSNWAFLEIHSRIKTWQRTDRDSECHSQVFIIARSYDFHMLTLERWQHEEMMN